MLVDSHCHLDFPEFANNLPNVVTRAKANEVLYMQTICTSLTRFEPVVEVARKFDNIFASVGVHPNNVEKEPDFSKQDLLALTKDEKVIGIGETGLDYYYQHSDRKKQQESFIKHINVSRKTGLPLIVHTRNADEDTVKILKNEMKNGSFPGLIHCFTASEFLAKEVLQLGFYISISGIVTFKNAPELQEIAKNLPLDRLLVETDAPYLAPAPFRGKTNEPAYVKNTAEFLANLKEISYNELASATTSNFFSLFTKAKRVS